MPSKPSALSGARKTLCVTTRKLGGERESTYCIERSLRYAHRHLALEQTALYCRGTLDHRKARGPLNAVLNNFSASNLLCFKKSFIFRAHRKLAFESVLEDLQAIVLEGVKLQTDAETRIAA